MTTERAERPCGLILHSDATEITNVQQVKSQLEKGNDEEKIEALKKTIYLLLNGESAQQLLVPVIRFVTPSKNHTIKKLLLIFWELLDKDNAGDTMLLIPNALLRDLNYPNEYVRGSTLRFLCKLSDASVLPPLVEAVRENLKHPKAYVRRNAVLAIYSIYKDFPHLVPDAPDGVYEAFGAESDPSCKRNMFVMLFNCAQEKAIVYLHEVLDQVQNFGEILQLIIVEMIRKVVRVKPTERGRYIKCIFSLLSSHSSAVQFEAAQTLVSLSAAPTAIKAATSTYINLLVRESDNNVKLIVLDRIMELQKKHTKVLQRLAMDILRGLATPNMEIRQKTLQIALDLVAPFNIHEVVLCFKKEMNKTQAETFENANEYRQMLVKATHSCAVKFPDVAHDVVHVLMDFLGDDDAESASEVIDFVREVTQTYPDLRQPIVQKLTSSLDQIKAGRVFRAALWIIGEYADTAADVRASIAGIKTVLGSHNFLTQEEPEEKKPQLDVVSPSTYSGPNVLADGTYASSSALTEAKPAFLKQVSQVPSLRQLIINGDFFLASVLSTTLIKLVLKSNQLDGVPKPEKHSTKAQVLLYCVGMMRLLKEKSTKEIDRDSYERLCLAISILSTNNHKAQNIILNQPRQSFVQYLTQSQLQQKKNVVLDEKDVKEKVDDLIKIRQFKSTSRFELDSVDGDDLTLATGNLEKQEYNQKLERIVQLTGFSDPVYAEADIVVNQYDILLDVTVINQTSDTLQNLCLELATLGDLKLVERPQNKTLGPYAKRNIKANIKVSSTETGVIFGSIVYDIAGSAHTERSVVLNEIRIDVVDYISPAFTSESNFRKMWGEFEWENKVVVHTNKTELQEYLSHLIKSTNMNCLTPESLLTGDCGFLSANLYARSVFGEDALANVSIEQSAPKGKITGIIRIRSKTQGIAVSLGKKAEALTRL